MHMEVTSLKKPNSRYVGHPNRNGLENWVGERRWLGHELTFIIKTSRNFHFKIFMRVDWGTITNSWTMTHNHLR